MVQIALDLADGHSKRSAARRASISPDTFYSWRRNDRAFADMLDRAIALFEDRLVETIWRAAVEGTTTLYYGPNGAVALERRVLHWEAAAWLLDRHPDRLTEQAEDPQARAYSRPYHSCTARNALNISGAMRLGSW